MGLMNKYLSFARLTILIMKCDSYYPKTMKRSLIFIILVLALLPLSLSARTPGAWYVGVTGNYDYNMLMAQRGYYIGTSYEPGHGFGVSIPVSYQVNEWFGIETGLGYVQKNYLWRKTIRDTNSVTELYEKQTNHFIEVPLSLCFSVGNESVSAIVSTGVYLGFWAASYREGLPYHSSSGIGGEGMADAYRTLYSFSESDNRFEFGFLFRSGFEIALDPFVLFMRGSYNISVTDLSKTYQLFQIGRYNSTITAEIGALYRFGGAK